MKRWLCLALCALLLPGLAAAETDPRQIQWTKREAYDQQRTRWSHVERVTTASAEVNEALRAMVDEQEAALYALLPEDKTHAPIDNSALRLHLGYRLAGGGTWAGFLMVGYTKISGVIGHAVFQTYNADLATGKQLTLSDVLRHDAATEAMLAAAVRTQLSACYGGMSPDAAALDALTAPDAIWQIPFTLGAVELTLYADAQALFPDVAANTLHVRLYYPALTAYLTQEAALQTALGDKKLIALTFDDGPSQNRDAIICEKMRKYGARGTFFQVGTAIQNTPETVWWMHHDNQSLQYHSMAHQHASEMTPQELQDDLAAFDTLVMSIKGEPMRLLRAPYGDYGPYKHLPSGYPIIQWKMDTFDWKSDTKVVTVSYIASRSSQDGDIVLMHDINDKAYRAMESMLMDLQRFGFICVTVEEMFAARGIALMADQAYYEARIPDAR